MLPYPLTNFEMQNYYQDQPKSIGVYSRNKAIGNHWITLYVNGDDVTYFDSFGAENIPKEISKFIDNKNITTNTYRIQAIDSIMYGYFCIGFIDFMLKSKSLLDYTHWLSPNEYKKNDKLIPKCFQ